MGRSDRSSDHRDADKVDFHHRERRYHLTDEAVVARLYGELLSRHKMEEYEVHTLYLDVPKGSWSKPPKTTKRKAAPLPLNKFRVRTYLSDGAKFFETKLHTDGDTTKHRQPMGPHNEWILDVLKPVCQVQYTRRAYDYRGLRVTIDRDVRMPLPVDTELKKGMAVGHDGISVPLEGYVIEVKGARVPRWLTKLLPKEETASWSSKSTWCLTWMRAHPREGIRMPDGFEIKLAGGSGCGLVVPDALTTFREV